MNTEKHTIVGIIFYEEDLEEILNYLHEKNFFSKEDVKSFYKQMNINLEISSIFYNIIKNKKIKNPPLMELIDIDMSGESYFLGYRINQYPSQIPTNSQELYEIKMAEDNWFNLFKEIPLTQSINF